MNKVFYIFLDIDGVLNNVNYTMMCYSMHNKSMSMCHTPFDSRCIYNLMLLVQKLSALYDVKIILSSTWRLNEIDYSIVNARLAEYGLKLGGKTPNIDGNRGLEIKSYLESNSDYADFIIIDDDSFDIEPIYPDNLVKTSGLYGFTSLDLDTVLKKLLKKGLLK